MRETGFALVLLLVLASCTGFEPRRDPSAPGQDLSGTSSAGSSSTTAPTPPAASATTTPIDHQQDSSRVCWSAPTDGTAGDLTFADATSALGLMEPLTGIMGHAVGWGDINGDGWPDLVVGTFADRPIEDYRRRGADGPSIDRLLLGDPNGFQPDNRFVPPFGRTSGIAFADLDHDGDLELILGRNVRGSARGSSPTLLYENRNGEFTLAAELVPDLGARSIGVLDFDADGRLDLFIVEDRWSGGGSVLLKNTGDLRFVEATRSSGLPTDVHGLGIGIADLTGDHWPDIFVSGSNRLFVANADGTFREATSPVANWPIYGNEDDPAGVAIADLNRDGRLDLVIGQHHNSTLDAGVLAPIRVYLNDGVDGEGDPGFTEVTDQAQIPGLPTKAPHVEIADFDNDGWPDILATSSTADGAMPTLFRHLGTRDGVPQFAVVGDLGDPHYWVTGGSVDVDRDGRLDILLIEWDPGLPSILFRNTSEIGHWLSVEVNPPHGSGLGSTVNVYETGRLGDPAALLGSLPIAASTGYGAGTLAAARFGLGRHTIVDVELELPHGRETQRFLEVETDHHIRLPGGCR